MTDYDNSGPLDKSKSQRKREMLALQALGEELVSLSTAQLSKLPLPDALLEAILMAQRIHSHGAKRRQAQYIGRLMRDVDPDPIRQALAKLKNQRCQANTEFHRLEMWRDRLIKEGVAIINEALDVFPMADRQQLLQLIHNAQSVAMTESKQASRHLFQYLRDLQSGNAGQ